MKITSLLFVLLFSFGVQMALAQEEGVIEVTASDKAVIAENLEKEADSDKHPKKIKKVLKKIANIFKSSKTTDEVEGESKVSDCVDCTRKQKIGRFFKKLGIAVGKGSAWLTTTTSKPILTGVGFVVGSVEKRDKNKELLALYTFFLNHQKEFDDLYLEAGAPDEMVDLALATMEDLIAQKSKPILRDFLKSLKLDKKIPEDISEFELSNKEFESIKSKLNPDVINNHPAYQELRPLIGDITEQELTDLVKDGYYNKSVSIKTYEAAMPNAADLIGTLVGQIAVPRIILGSISGTLASLYTGPVVAAQFGTAISAGICLQEEIQEKFKKDEEVRLFCSYVINRTGYQLVKGRAKGYVAGKKFHVKIADKIKKYKEKRAAKRAAKNAGIPIENKENQLP